MIPDFLDLRRRSVRRRIVVVALLGYLVAMAWLVFGPDPGSGADLVGTGLRDAGAVAADEVSLGMSNEEISNVVLFIPLPVLVAMWWPRWWWLAVPAGVVISFGIEVAQKLAFPHRSPQWRDVRWNTLGTLLGSALVLAAVAAIRILDRYGDRDP